MSAIRYARRVSAAESALVAVPAEFIEARRWTRSPELFDLSLVERWLILRSYAKGARRADA
ncbi:hypothetical protein SK224_10925 [Microbacterium sp. BG28]|uniref:hypothetical protein n=1 Tax=Microbacterium sp. BG28 TaxID=3097356 RepID=UPI002A5A7131|nr:hypothetical protein [Microbacterium sp. BG28]MDY0829632.1 hypothetical protein [Microbacterium sp. BG28]